MYPKNGDIYEKQAERRYIQDPPCYFIGGHGAGAGDPVRAGFSSYRQVYQHYGEYPDKYGPGNLRYSPDLYDRYGDLYNSDPPDHGHSDETFHAKMVH